MCFDGLTIKFDSLTLAKQYHELYDQVLTWDYHSTSVNPQSRITGEVFEAQRSVPDTFETAEEYKEVFFPLMLHECWESMQVSKREMEEEKPFFFKFEREITLRNGQPGGTYLKGKVDKMIIKDMNLNWGDIVVVSLMDKIYKHPKKPNIHVPSCLAKVENIGIISGKEWYVNIVLKDPPSALDPCSLDKDQNLHLFRTMSLVPTEREYSCFQLVQNSALRRQILNAEVCELVKPSTEEIEEAISTYELNKSQAEAVIGAKLSSGFSLFQGPPGTGKTKTILAMLSAFLEDSVLLKARKKRVLVCAPSNAAVDEILFRLKGGLKGVEGVFHPKMVRLGLIDKVHPDVETLTLVWQINEHIHGEYSPTKIDKHVAKLKQLREKREFCFEESELSVIENDIELLTNKITFIKGSLEAQYQRMRQMPAKVNHIRTSILGNADIVCATLSGSGQYALSSLDLRFDTVIIDEAAQCTELASLIPMQYRCRQCIMVDDPKQLPPTVLSTRGRFLNYDTSLFVRMFSQYPEKAHMLDVQYRMHPDISSFPSLEFYNGMLKTHKSNIERTGALWQECKDAGSPQFKPYQFLDTEGTHQVCEVTKSSFNTNEVKAVFELYERLQIQLGQRVINGNVGIISPYKKQIELLKDYFVKHLDTSAMEMDDDAESDSDSTFGPGNTTNLFGAKRTTKPTLKKKAQLIEKYIDLNTVDGFQGQEKDIIIISCVRAGEGSRGIGFLSDTRRLNVALTRAKSACWVVGHKETLMVDDVWKRLVEDAEERGMLMEYK